MFVVLDTNIWLEELALSSSAGSAFRFFLNQGNGKLVVPEVVRLEVVENLTAKLSEAISEITRGERMLVSLLGTRPKLNIPQAAHARGIAEGVFAKLGVPIRDVPFSLESARSSFEKTITKSAPSNRNQQFKDGVLWADCIQLLNEGEVLLVTHDRAFFEGQDPNRGLASNLLAEVAERPNDLKIIPSLKDALAHVEGPLKIDTSQFWNDYELLTGGRFQAFLLAEDIAITGAPEVHLDCYITEKPDVVHFTYEIDIPASRTSGEPVRGTLAGSGTFQIPGPTLKELLPDFEGYAFVDATGVEKRKGTHFLRAGSPRESRTTVHKVRRRIDRG